MKIKTQFVITMSLFGLAAGIIVISLMTTNQKVSQLNQQQQIAQNIERSARELDYLSNEYLLYRENQQRARWESKFASLSNDLTRLNPTRPDQQVLVNDLKADMERLKAVFANVISMQAAAPSPDAGAKLDFIQASWSRMEVQNQNIAFRAQLLAQNFRTEIDRLNQNNNLRILVLSGVLGAYFATNYLLIFRRTLNSISKLQEGTRTIGSGNLDFVIAEKTRDEIGELTQAFNQMTANLKLITTSNTDLERVVAERTAQLNKELTERKRAEQALHESEEKFSVAFNSNSVALSIATLDGRYTEVNDAFCDILGYAREELIGKTSKELGIVEAKDHAEIIHAIDNSGGSIDNVEVTARTRDGKLLTFLVSTKMILLNNVPQRIVTNVDITERKRMEQERLQNLRYFESMDKVNRVIQDANDLEQMMSDVLDEVLSIFDCDRAFLAHPLDPDAESYSGEMIRCRPEYPATHSRGAIIPMDPLANKFMRAMLASKDPVQVGPEATISLTQEISKRFDLKSIMGMALYPKVDTPWEFAINQCSYARVWNPEEERLFKEIGRRVGDALTSWLSHRNLLASEERFRRLTENARDVIYRMSLPDGRYEYVSPAALSVFGYSPEEFYNVPDLIKKAIHPDWHEYFEDQWEHLIKGEMPPTYEYQIIHKSGEIRWMNQRNILVRDDTGNPIAIEGIVTDITERKQAEEALRINEGRYRKAQAMGQVGNWEYNLQTTEFWGSDEAKRIYGFDLEQFNFTTDEVENCIPERERVHQALIDLIEADKPYNLEFEIHPKNSLKPRIISSVAELKRDEHGNPLLVTGVIQDITERKQSEKKIRRQIDYLTALQDIDRAIVAAFEMRSSLNALISKSISLLAVDAAAISLIDLTMNSLEFVAGDGFRTDAIKAPNVKLSESYAGRVTLKQHIVTIPNPKNEPDNLFLTDFFKGEDFVSYYGAPLIVKGKAIGVLEVFQRSLIKRDQEWLDFLNALAGQSAVAISSAQLFDNLQQSNSELIQAYDATIEGWSRALDLRDKETEGHSQRVTEGAVKLARAFGLSEAELVQVRWGALLHDIGKMGVPDGILHKPSALTDEEWAVMRLHPTFAYELLAPIHYLRLALDIPYCHHEKWDGTGYPRGLKGAQIPLTARIFAVVDVWDALISDRPYRPAWGVEKVREHMLAESGTHFDPQVADVFIQMRD
jgi:PAS domain S-box-containing protein